MRYNEVVVWLLWQSAREGEGGGSEGEEVKSMQKVTCIHLRGSTWIYVVRVDVYVSWLLFLPLFVQPVFIHASL